MTDQIELNELNEQNEDGLATDQTELNEDGLVPGQPVDSETWARIEHERHQKMLQALSDAALGKPAPKRKA